MMDTQTPEAVPQSDAAATPPPDSAVQAEGQPQASEKQVTLWDKLTVKPAEVEAAAAEVVADEPKPVVEKKPRQARKLADLAEREAAAALSAKEKAELEVYRRDIADLKTDPLRILEKAGLTYETLTVEALKGKGSKAPSPEVQAVRAELQKEIDGIKAAEFNRQVDQFKGQLRQYIDSEPERYKYTVARGDHDKVWDTMVQIAQQSGGKSTPTYEQAAKFYEAQLEKEAEVFMAVKAKTDPPVAAKVEAAEKVVPAKQAAKPALTNALGSGVVATAPTKAKTKAEAFSAFKALVDKAYRGETLR